jgi:hypothetical protein
MSGYAKVDVYGRLICSDCAGTDALCQICEGTGVIGTLDELDAEDVTPVGRDMHQLEHPAK